MLETALKALHKAPWSAWFGLLVISGFVAATLFAPAIAPYGETDIVGEQYLPPDDRFLLGTDNIGRDLFSRLIHGARNTVGLAFVTTCLAFLTGAVAGLLTAIAGGWADRLLTHAAAVVTVVPELIFALLLLAVVDTSITNLVLVVAMLDAPRVFGTARASALAVLRMDYVEAARLRGEGTWWIVRRELLPNTAAPLLAEFGQRFCFVFLLISALGFLGLGFQPPAADWGSMVRDNATLITFGEPVALYPAAAITLLATGVHLMVDWMTASDSATPAGTPARRP